jgi:tetratricopeptide (TPR) repeat protein
MEQRDLLDRTLVVLTSDHGEGLGEHGESTHGIFIYDATLHVPLIFSRSGLPAGRRVDMPVRLVDVLPTVLELLRLPPANPARDGVSLAPVFAGRGTVPVDACYIESLAPLLDRNWAPLSGLRTGEWKYIRAPEPELYDLVSDPGEKNNLHNERPEVARRLRAELERIVELAVRPEAPALAVEATPAADEVRRKLATLGYVSGGFRQGEEARPDPKRMIDLDNRFNRAIDLSEGGDLENADALYRRVLEEQPDFIVGYEFAAYNLYKMGKPAEAVALLERALNHGLDSPTLQARLGLYYQETDRLDQSIRLLERTVKENGTYAEAFNSLGITYYRSGRLEDAADSFRRAISLDGSYAMAINNLGNCLLAQGDFDRAAETYRAALKVDDRLAAAWNGLGVVLYRKGEVAEALSLWERSVALDGSQADTLFNLGKTLLRLGREAEALRYFEMFLDVASPVRYARDIEKVREVIKRIKRERAAARSAGAGEKAG